MGPAPRLVLLYAPCTVNKDYLAPYNSNVPYTPNLKQFAESSVVFTKHHTEAGTSGIAYASILTGNQSHRHSIYRHPARLPDDAYLVFEAYSELGYETFFWNSHKMASPELNYGQGVQPKNMHGRTLIARNPGFKEILDRLRSDTSYRAFVFTHFTVTHGPYSMKQVDRFLQRFPAQAGDLSAPEIDRFGKLYQDNHFGLSWNTSQTIEELGLSESDAARMAQVIELLYRSTVWHLDRMFGEVVAQIESFGLRDQSLIAFTADHGEVLDRDQTPFTWSHSMQLASEVLNVPLLISMPGLEAGPYDHVTRSIDLFPTLLGLTGNLVPAGRIVQGVDLSSALMNRDLAPGLLAYSHTTVLVHTVFKQMYHPDQMQDWEHVRTFFPKEDVNLIWAGVREGNMIWKLRKFKEGTWGMEAFDLTDDPVENTNLYDPNNHQHVQMAEKLDTYKKLLARRYEELRGDGSARTLTEVEEIEALRSLGYIK